MDVLTLLVLIFVQTTPLYSATTPTPVPCTPPSVSDSTYLPNPASFNDGENIVFMCDEGYERTLGDDTLTCNSDGSWNGTTPVCTIKTCAAVDITNGARNPLQAQYNYNTDVTYSCDEGYTQASGDLVRTCTTSKTWSGTEPVCTIITCTSSDALYATKSPTLSSVDYSTSVSYTCDLGYELAGGDAVRTCQASGDLSGTLPVCSIITCSTSSVSFATKSPASSAIEFNTSVTYTCDVGYDLISGYAIRTCQASGELAGTPPVCTIVTCVSSDASFASKSPAYSAIDFNTSVTYTCDVGYNLTSGDTVRTCKASGELSGTPPICIIVTCVSSDASFASKSPVNSAIDFNTYVTYTCDVGYDLTSGDTVRTCQSSGELSGTPPVCIIVTCVSSDASFASKLPMSSAIDFNTSVTYTCDVGFDLASGDTARTCQASGELSGTPPNCIIVTCLSSDASFASKSPASSAIDFNTSVTYTCDVGYDLTSGDGVRTCQASGDLSGEPPICSIVTCPSNNVSFASKSPASSAIDFNTSVTYSCDEGYNLSSGDAVRTCQASGDLSGTLPFCSIVTCSASSVSLASKSPASSAIDFNTSVTYTCDVGYDITSGDAVRKCQASGDLNGTLPVCSIVNCPSSDINFGAKLPTSSSIVFNTSVTYTCDVGYEVTSGDAERTCQASGDLSGTLPVCSIKTCAAEVVSNAAMTPNDPTFDYNTAVSYACELGYDHTNGDLSRTCQANTTWSGDAPTCTIVTCTEPANATFATKSPIQSSYDYSEQVTYKCDTGYNHDSGDLTRTCTETGAWSGALPACIIVTCAAPSSVAHSTHAPAADPYNYDTTVTYTCETGYEHKSGSLSRTCQANGAFNGTAPVCSIKQCSKEDVTNGTPDPDKTLYDYGTSVTYECALAYNHTSGNLTRECDSDASWTGTLPVCTVAACIPETTNLGSYDPPDVTIEFGAVITYTCDLGYYISAGDATRTCVNDGSWTNTLPTCSLVRCDAPDPVSFSSHTPVTAQYDYNTGITYSCNLAYNHTAGDLTRTCTEHFNWTDTEPTCTIAACIQEDSTFMETTPDKTLHEFDDFIIYECILGYNHSSGDLNRTCQNDGIWTGVKPECVIVTCDKPNVPAHASITPDVPEVNYDTYITYACDLGYNRTDGDETRRCTENATFEGVEANCTLVTCDPPAAISDGTYSPILVEHDYNTVVTFICDFGYYNSSGDLIQRCDENADWVNPKPVCEIVKCAKPTENHATVSPDQSQYNFNISVTSTCVTGYNLTDGDATRTCQHTGEWDGTPPNCTIVECDTPAPVLYSSHTPQSSVYVYLNTLTYTCNTGYELTSGNNVRTCTETGEWTGSAPNCTIIHCPLPPDGVQNTYSPAVLDYIWNDTVEYTCNIGYIYSSGDLTSACLHDKTWSAVTPTCIIVTCDKIDVPLMTFDPPTADTHDFNTTIEYSCVVGYNHSYGDLFRTCNYTGEWTGTLPNCTIITCDPPAAISHTSYVPVQVEHDWNTAIDYSCDPTYHYVSGVNTTTCNESGSFPPVDLDCSVEHLLTIEGSEPAITWINATVPQADIAFDFDGICDVTITCAPNLLGVSRAISGNQIIMNVTQIAGTNLSEYTCTLAPFHGERSFQDVKRNVFYGNAIVGFQAWLNHTEMYLIVGETYHFEAKATQGSVISIVWALEDNVTRNFSYNDEFTYMDFVYEFISPTKNVTVSINNAVSNDSITIPLIVIYALNGINFTVNEERRNTTETAHFELDIDIAANIPMAEVNITITFHDGNATINCIHDIQDSFPAPLPHQYNIIYDIQGNYNVTAVIHNPVSSMTFHKYMRIWDELENIELSCLMNCPIAITGTSTRIEFAGVPRSGFEYLIDMLDANKTLYQSFNSSILYELNSLSFIDHIYTSPGNYNVQWNVSNGGYTKDGIRWILVQNEITDFQAWIDHSDVYVEVGESYHFEANATHGSLVSMQWILEDNVTQLYTFNSEFSNMEFDYAFTRPRTNVTVTANNIVSNVSTTIPLFVIYALNGINFTVNEERRTTTETAHFELDIDIAANIPMAEVNVTITLHDGNAPINFIHDIQDSLPASLPHQYDINYGIQGNYNVTAFIQNPLKWKTFHKYMRIWDKLEDVKLSCVLGCPAVATNTPTRVEFTGVPPSGFEYIIEMKDSNGTIFQSYNSSILYEVYSLSYFEHTYTIPKNFKVTWSVSNGAYTKDGIRWVIVQNAITDLQAYLDHHMIYLAVGEAYTFTANATDGTSVYLDWDMETNVTVTQSYAGMFSTGNLSYAFQKPKHNVTVTGRNRVSSYTLDILVEVFYKVNKFTLSVDNTLGNTTEPVKFDLYLLPTASLPMDDVNISIDFKHGDTTTDSKSIDANYGVDLSHFYDHLFDIQGNFLVEAKVESILGYEIYNITVGIWDSLLQLELEFVNAISGKYIITNTPAQFNFTNVPNYGFKYSIDYGDSNVDSDNEDHLLYKKYNLSVFSHAYASPGVYIVRWTAYNGEPSYNRDEHFAVHVQNVVPDTGYTLEPLGKKYPWTFVQNVSIGLNITLDIGVPLPTNATCVFHPDDGNSSVSDLTFDSSFFKHSHEYRTEGLFNATFNCSNDVSYYVYGYDIRIKKFQASELKLVFHNYVPLNKSDTATVYFHIYDGDYAVRPFFVYLTWDYGDGTTSRRRRASLLYDKQTFTHLYTERGNYTVTVLVEALASNTTNTEDYSLRLGLMYFEFNTTVQFLSTTVVRYTMYGVSGTTTYTVNFDDSTSNENCSSIGPSSCDIHHLCPEYGYKSVEVTATNGTFIEIDSMNMTCDNPIVNLTSDIPYTVAIPNGTIDARLRIKQDDLFLPKLFCNWNMGDPIRRETYGPMSQEVTYDEPYLFNFQYIALGRHTITIDCWNLINSTKLTTQITVTNKDFLFTGVFDRFYSQEDCPMYISSMIDTEIFNRLEIVASADEKSHSNLWLLNVSLGETNPNRQSLLFTRGLVRENKYYVTCKVCFKEEPGNCIFEPTYAQFVMPPPHAEIVGNTRRYVGKGSVTMNASLYSYDPVNPQSTDLEYTWECKSVDASSFDDAVLRFKNNSVTANCTYTDTSTGVISIDTNSAPVASHYAVTVTVDNKRGMTAEFTQIAAVQTNKKQLTIKCKINCLSKVARSSKLQLVPDLTNNCPATFVWKLKKYSGSEYVDEDLSSYTYASGSTARSLTILENKLEYGAWYLVTLDVLISGVSYGPAYYEILVNRPPQGGFCKIIPFNETTLIPMNKELENTTTSTGAYKLTAGKDVFNITCKDWEDEGFTDNMFSNKEPIFYLFFLSYGNNHENDDTKRQLLYFDPGQTSNLVTFQVGNVINEYKATVVVRINDVFGDYTDVKFSVKSEPSLTTANLASRNSQGMKTVVSEYVDQFDDELIKANRTNDYRTISRKVMDIASVYNELALNTSSGVILSPEDLLSLGYVKTEDDKLLSWQDYWKIIVEVTDTTTSDFLITVGEEYAYMLYASIEAWPSTKRMTLVAIETISRALNSSTSKLEFSNVTAAILGAKSADILARNLATISDDRSFPNTNQLFSALISVRDLIRNILAILQTVLTPNLPQDPSVDEMRNYLEYIKIFKTTEEVFNAPLSIQEQTFLAQKQLQKYYLQKHIKSEASKIALPYLTYALRNLTYVLERMSVVGQEDLYLENDYVYVSVEVHPAYDLVGGKISRPRVALELNGLYEDNTQTCNSSEVILKTIVFKHNPYFWGKFADRITSYVPLFEINGAHLASDVITYRLENKVEAQCKDQDPTYEVADPDKMIYILFDRQHAEDDILIFVRPNTSDLIYELYFNKNDKPKVADRLYTYSTVMKKNDETWTLSDGYKLLVKSSEYSETGKIWIGLRPLLENSGDLSLLTRKFCANVTSVSCLAWRPKSGSSEYEWDKDRCEVSLSSTRAETVCSCQNTDTGDIVIAGTTFYVPYNMIDFKALDELSVTIGRSPVIGMMVATFCAYILLVIWAWREDVKDQYKWSYSLMIDNDIADSCFYIFRVFTGLRTGAGTQSKIGFVLVGEDGDTNIRILDDDSHVGFDRGSVRTFVMSTRKYLGDLISLRIWHDDSGGNNSSWYLNKINVTDLRTGRRYAFVCNQWFDYDNGDTRVDRVLSAQPYEEVRSYEDMVSYTIAENHLWISVVIRPLKSNFTRIQRLSCLLGLIYLTMIICTMILETPDEETTVQQVVIGPFRFSMENSKAAVIAVTVASVIIILVSFLFKNAESDDKTPNVDSVDRRVYRKVNEKVKLDTSVLSRRFLPPAEQALEYNYFFLPHMCVYVAWTILAMSLIMATYLLVSFSSEWKLIKSEEWMTAVFVSMMCSFILVEGVKIAIILLAYCLLCQRAYEPPEPYIDVDSLEEITKYNSATLTIGPQFSSVLHKPENPSKGALIKNQIKRIRNHQFLKILSQLIAYSALLYLVYTISYESRDPRSFYLKNHVENLFHFKSEVAGLESYTDWLKGTFVNTYFSKTFFGAEYGEGNENKKYMEDLSNMRVGPARLRQLRVRPGDCIGPLGVNMTCRNKYEEVKKQTQDFCLGWKEKQCPVSEKSTYFTSPAWEYTSADEIWGFPTVATYCTYGGGGYFMKLDVNRDVCEIIFDELVRFGWFDDETRAVILEFTLYNANTNLFVYSKYVAEFPEVGGFLPYLDIQVFRLHLNSGPDGDFILFLQFFFLLIVIAATFVSIYEMCTDFRAYFKSVWNILDLTALVMSYTTISIFIYKIHVIQKTIEVFENDKNAYVGFENLAFYDFITNTAYGVLVFLLSIRVSRILGYSGKINEMADVISIASKDLSGFLLIFAITYFAYVGCGTLLFGKEQEKYKDLFQTYGTLTEAIIGKNRVSNILTAKPGFAEFYYFTFVLFVLMTLATMAAAILNFSISVVRAEQQKLAPTNIVEVIFDRIGKLVDKIMPSRNRQSDDKRNERRDSDAELSDILADLHSFINGLRAKKDKKTKPSDKYKLTENDSQ